MLYWKFQGQTLPYIMASKACFHFKSHLTARNKTHCHLFSLAIYTIYYYSRCRTPTIDAQGRAPSIIMYFFFLCATTKPPHYSNCICTTICITSVPRGEYQQKRAFLQLTIITVKKHSILYMSVRKQIIRGTSSL